MIPVKQSNPKDVKNALKNHSKRYKEKKLRVKPSIKNNKLD